MLLRQIVAPLATVALFAALAAPPCTASDGDIRPIQQTINVLDSAGNIQVLQPEARETARVFVFLTGECPISRAYLPVLGGLDDQWSKGDSHDVILYGVWADGTTKPDRIARFVQEHQIRFPILLDRDGELARRLKPVHVPEAVVLNADGFIAYQGRIDDTFPELGRRRRQAPTENTLANAVTALCESKPISAPRTESVGCLYETPPAPEGEAHITYTRDIAPILFANCVSCHREGEVGPFPLTGYEDAAKRARLIARVTEKKLMPPWMPSQTHGEFDGQRTLTSRQIETLRAWAEGDRALGDPADLPPEPQFVSGWRLGKPDVILEMPEPFEVRADGPDIYQNFVIPIDIPEDKLVAAVDFVPGNPRVVHHSLLFLDANHTGRKLDAATPEPGYESFGGPGFMPTGSIGGWSLGKTPKRLPHGLGRFLKKGSDLVMQIHYHPNGDVETDRSKVGVYFVDQPRNIAADIWAAAFEHDIPPGEKNYHLNASFTLPSDVELLGIIPHMHLLGRSVRAVARLPDGAVRELIDIPRWNFNWQDDYRFVRSLKLPQGTRLEVAAEYDNSADNKLNPNDPPERVTWGEGTGDEMLYCFFFVATENPRDLTKMVGQVLAHEVIAKSKARRKDAAHQAGTSIAR
jgi:hypothetical protein